MKDVKPMVLFLITLALSSCVTTTDVENDSARHEGVEAQAWSLDRLPRLRNREDFEDMIIRLKLGSEKDRRTMFVACQMRMDSCLPFIIEHLEDPEPFKGVDYPLVSRRGMKVGSVSIPAKNYSIGAALERFLISYFFKDPARKTFHPLKRENSILVWKKWHNERSGHFRWNSWGLYSNK